MTRALLGLLALAAATPALAAPAPAPLTAELRANTQALLDAVAPGDRTVWERLLDPAYLNLDENGAVRTKAQLLAELDPLPAGLVGSIRVDSFRVELDGEVAIAIHEDQESLEYFGQHLGNRFRSFDTWQHTQAGWRLIGQHSAAVLRDPPAVTLSHEELCGYAGTYALTDAIAVTISCDGDALVAARAGRPAVRYRPELRDLFFAAGQPRSRRIFLRDAAGHITGFADRREGEDIVWRRRG